MKLTCNFEEMRMQLIYNNYKTIGPNIEVPMLTVDLAVSLSSLVQGQWQGRYVKGIARPSGNMFLCDNEEAGR
ncbi:hypothetical protein V1477_006217 [Vespula maculifrons]|uniref:Uncharacterized protein n=2 Tax=Vespula TaxID=7451 RepID=A0A836UKF8_VESVU|nr:hypothetical protein HZH66_003585 [Vespula vulgaris]